MATFNLGKFRDLAFGRKAEPDHPMHSTEQAKKILALLPLDDPDHALAELTHWVSTMNATDTFAPGLRARILLQMNESARLLWRAQSERYLAPEGRPMERRDGDEKLLRALHDCAAEFANGFAIAQDAADEDDSWLKKNRALICSRNMRWLSRRLAISHMLHLSSVAAIWERLHRLHAIAEEAKYARQVVQMFRNEEQKASVRVEYAQALLLELAAPDSLHGREVELTFRIARRCANAVLIERERSPEATFAVTPLGDARPVLARNIGAGAVPAPFFISTANCLPRLRAALERDLDADPADPDTLFGKVFTVRERHAMLKRLLEHWGPNPPQRRTKRVVMATPVRLITGFDNVLSVLPALEKRAVPDADTSRRTLQLKLDATSKSLKHSQIKAARQNPARLVDASPSGLGIAIRRGDAGWAALGTLVAVLIEPGKDWILCVLRRVFSVDDELRLGLQLLSAKPRTITLQVDPQGAGTSAWEDAMRHEATFKEHFRSAILLEPQTLPLAGADFLLGPACASRGTQFDLQLARGTQRLRVTRLLEDNAFFQRAAFEPLQI